MKTVLRVATLLSLLSVGIPSGLAQEKVTISKSRLEELERKEAELDKLRSASPIPNAATSAVTQPGVSQTAPTLARQAAPAYQAPAISSLAPLKQGETVSAMDVASHYANSPAAADARYRKQTFVVAGEVAAIEKHLMRRTFGLTLKTGESLPRVICEITAPDQYNAIYTKDAGAELVGVAGQSQDELARIGKPIQVQVRSKGLKGSAVVVSGKLLH